jgi:hypothetical protein
MLIKSPGRLIGRYWDEHSDRLRQDVAFVTQKSGPGPRKLYRSHSALGRHRSCAEVEADSSRTNQGKRPDTKVGDLVAGGQLVMPRGREDGVARGREGGQ